VATALQACPVSTSKSSAQKKYVQIQVIEMADQIRCAQTSETNAALQRNRICSCRPSTTIYIYIYICKYALAGHWVECTFQFSHFSLAKYLCTSCSNKVTHTSIAGNMDTLVRIHCACVHAWW